MLAELSNLSSADRPLAMRMRPDLECRQLSMRGRPQWSIKDPLARRFYQLREEEFFVLRQLDGRISMAEIGRRFEREFAPRRLAPLRLQAYLGLLHRSGLIVAEAQGQGEELLDRRKRLVRESWLEAASNLLSLRFRGVNPDRFLGWLEPRCRWIFTRGCAAVCGLLIGAALVLVAVHFGDVLARLPDARAFFSTSNIVWLMIVLAGMKVLHELGHAVSCRHFGGRCHELGLMLLVFTPCLYCDVSDAWMLRQRWRRIAIGAAGMAVELVLAAVATFLWWWSEPGWLNSVCLDVMFICSVSTLLLNGNPLLRYDGYYILADLLETPNLQQQASGVVRRWAARWLLGIETPPDRLLPERGHWLLALYAMASTVYRLAVVVAILWFLKRAAAPYRLEFLVDLFGLVVIGGLVVGPVVRLVRWLRDQQREDEVRWARAIVRGSLLLVAAAIVLSIPLPYRVTAPLALEPRDAERIYVTAPGRLVSAVVAGEHVDAGQILATLENLDLTLELAQLTGQRDAQRLHLATLQSRQGADPAAAAEIPTAKEALADTEDRLARRNEDLARLTLKARHAGTVLPPPRVPDHTAPGQLPTWSDSPLDEHNRGAYLETGTLVCLVGDPRQVEAVAVIDQADVDSVRVGQRVKVQFDESPGETLSGVVTDLAGSDLQVTPRELVARGDLPSRPDANGTLRPLEAVYQARIALDAEPFTLRSGASGRAKIIAEPQSLGRRLLRYLDRTFRLQW